MSKTPQERARAGMQRHRKTLAKQGRRQVAVHLTEPAIKALDDLGKAHGLDRSRVLDALLLGHITPPKPKRAKKPQPADIQDLFD